MPLAENIFKREDSFRWFTKTPREQLLEKLLRCCLRAFTKYLNTMETRHIRRLAEFIGIKI